MKRILKTNLFFLAQTLVFIIFEVVLAIMIAQGANFSGKIYQVQIIGTIAFLWIPAILYLFFRKKNLGCPIKDVLKIKKTKASNYLFCFLVFLCLQPIASFLNLITMLIIPNNVADFMNAMSSSGSDLLMIFTIAIMPALGEELVFRGIISDGYKNTPLVFMALMNGLLFGLFHMNPSQLLYAFILGVVFTYIVEYTGSIFTTMFIHFLFNGLSCILIIIPKYLQKFGLSESLVEESASQLTTLPPSIYIFYLIIATIAAIILYYILKKIRKDNNYDEKVVLKRHTIELSYDSSIDEFQGCAPTKSKVLAFIPLGISLILYIAILFL